MYNIMYIYMYVCIICCSKASAFGTKPPPPSQNPGYAHAAHPCSTFELSGIAQHYICIGTCMCIVYIALYVQRSWRYFPMQCWQTKHWGRLCDPWLSAAWRMEIAVRSRCVDKALGVGSWHEQGGKRHICVDGIQRMPVLYKELYW